MNTTESNLKGVIAPFYFREALHSQDNYVLQNRKIRSYEAQQLSAVIGPFSLGKKKYTQQKQTTATKQTFLTVAFQAPVDIVLAHYKYALISN